MIQLPDKEIQELEKVIQLACKMIPERAAIY